MAPNGNSSITHPVSVSIKGSDVDLPRSIGRSKTSPKDFARTRETTEDAMLENSKRNWNHTDRRHFIGGSDARVIMGQDEKALIRLWQEKRGEVGPEDLSTNLIVQLGLVTEDLNRQCYERNTGNASRTCSAGSSTRSS